VAEAKTESVWQMKILVLGGGNSPERAVSLRSAKAVAKAAAKAGFEVSEADPALGLTTLDSLTDAVVFPILHGQGGEDGELQAELEKRNLPFLGSGSESSANCFDKWKTRESITRLGIPMPKAERVSKETYAGQALSEQSHVLKVNRGGSSIGTLIIRQPGKVHDEQINKLFELDDVAVIEELIIGTEITVPVLDKTALPVIEIQPPQGLEFDYDNKYNGATAEICPPESISKQVQEEARRLAESVHQIMECRHLSRVDIMIDKSENLYVLEINTIPGLTDQSLYPRSAAVAGYDMPNLVREFAELVKRDYNL
jgi:D-alanine--D-alanine ligase